MININYNIDSYYNNLDNNRARPVFTQNEQNQLQKNNGYDQKSKSTFQVNDKLNLSKTELTEEERKVVEELKTIDQKVRAHEQAHLAAGGNLVRGGASFQYQVGPDGKQYAVGGEVKIDASPVPDDPEKTIQKMQQVRRAALAPSDPSPQDRKVASEASQIEARAAMEKSLQRNFEMNSKSKINKSNIAKYGASNNDSSLKLNRIG